MAILKYRSLFADVLPRRSPKPEKYAPLGKSDTLVSVSASASTSSLESITQPPAYSQAVGERSRKAVKVYPKPEADQVLSVTIRLRGDSYGEIFTTTATFQYVSFPRFLGFCYFILVLTVTLFKVPMMVSKTRFKLVCTKISAKAQSASQPRAARLSRKTGKYIS